MKLKALSINKNSVFDVLKGTLIAVICSLIGVLILAIVVKFAGVTSNIILPINQVIKIVSILLGCVLGIKNKEKGALKGGIIGLLYTVLAVFVFLIINKQLNGNSFNYIDFVTGIIAGIVSGIIAVNFKKKAK